MRSNIKIISIPYHPSKKIPRKKKKALKAPFVGVLYPLTINHGVYRRCKTRNKLWKTRNKLWKRMGCDPVLMTLKSFAEETNYGKNIRMTEHTNCLASAKKLSG